MSDVALVVDNPMRDLPGMALLGWALAERGLRTQLVPMNLQRQELPALRPRVAVLPYLRREGNIDVVERLLDGGIDVVVLDTEGGVIELDTYGRMLPTDRRLVEGVARWCTWGPRQAEEGAERGWYRPDQTTVTGPPRLDFYREPWRRAARSVSAAGGRSDPRPMALVIGSFPFANPGYRTPQYEVEARMRRHQTERAFVERELDIDRRTMDGMIDLVGRLVRTHPDVLFVFRPHPFERLETYHERLEPAENLVIDRTGSVDGWLLYADMVVQPPDCTVGVEAALAGVTVLGTDWLEQIRRYELVDAAVTAVPDPDAMVAAVGTVEKRTDHDDVGPLPAVIHDWFGPLDGQAHQRVADEIDKVARSHSGRWNERALRRFHHGVDDAQGRDRAIATGFHLAHLPHSFSPRRMRVERDIAWDTSIKAFGHAEVAAVVRAVADVDETEPPVVRPASTARDYAYGYRTGRSVVVEPRPALERPVARLGFAEAALGRHEGHVVSQSEVLAPLFRAEGYEVQVTSDKPHWLARAGDTVRSIVGWRGRVDVVVVGVFSARGFAMADLASLAGRKIGARVVFFLHGGSLPGFVAEHPRWVQRVIERGDLVLAPSRYLARSFEELGHRVEVVPNVVELEHYEHRTRSAISPRLLWMRKFGSYYAPELAIETLQRVRETYPDATMTMAGPDSGVLAATEALIRRLGLDDAVDIVGFLDREGKQRTFADHDVFLNTNRVDNTPVSVIEAGAFGLPVVATDAGGVGDLVRHEREALLVPVDDAEAMAGAVVRLLADQALVERLSTGGRALAERHSWPSVRDRWEQVLAEVMAR